MSADGSTVFVASYNNYSYALNAETGIPVWNTTCRPSGPILSPVVSLDGDTVFVKSRSQLLPSTSAKP